MPMSLGKLKWKVLGSIITSLSSWMYTPLIVMTWWNCYKVFLWFYYFRTKDCHYFPDFFCSLFQRFPAFIENNRIESLFDHLFGIKILILSFLCDQLLIIVWMVPYSIFLHHLLAMVHYLILLWQFLVLHQSNH